MISYLIHAAIISICAVIQLTFYINPKKKSSFIYFGLFLSFATFLYLIFANTVFHLAFSILYLLLPYIFFGNCFAEKFYCKLYNFCIQAIVSSAIMYLSGELFMQKPIIGILCSLLLNIVWCCLMGFLRKLTFNVMPYPEESYKKALFKCLLSYFGMHVYMCVDQFLYTINPHVTLPILFIVILILIVVNILDKFLISNAELRKTERMLQIEANHQLLKQYVVDYVNYEEKIKRMEHDQKHLIQGLKVFLELNDTERALNMLQKMSSELESNSGIIYCSDNFINAILSDASTKCKHKNILFDTSIQLGEAVCVYDNDLIAILMNIINNAIENCEPHPVTNIQMIKLTLFTSKNHMVIKCENTISVAPIILENSIKTTKKDTIKHGIGLESIKHIAHKYGGMMEITCEDSIFKIKVVMENVNIL